MSWLSHPPAGVARISAESHTFGALPVTLPEDARAAQQTTPGELLAVAHGMFMAVELAEVLTQAGTPASEIVVEAHATSPGRDPSRRSLQARAGLTAP